jgi:hypothetical protein
MPNLVLPVQTSKAGRRNRDVLRAWALMGLLACCSNAKVLPAVTLQHPGTVTFVDEAGEKVESADNVPQSIRFVANASGILVPVVRVVAKTDGNQRIIRSYGADGTELTSTVQLRNP